MIAVVLLYCWSLNQGEYFCVSSGYYTGKMTYQSDDNQTTSPPVCDLWCRFRLPDREKDIPHWKHVYLFSPLWVKICLFRWPGCEKIFFTLRTFVSLRFAVSSFMSLQVNRPWEGLVTPRAVIWFLSAVSHFMFLQAIRPQEGLFTLPTFVSLLSTVSKFMFLQVTRPQEGLFTLWTFVFLFSTVNQFLCLQVIRQGEGLSTLQTFISFLPSVWHLVCLQLTKLREVLVTQRASKRLLASVRPVMSL